MIMQQQQVNVHITKQKNNIMTNNHSSSTNRKKVNNYMICLDKPLGQGSSGKVYLSFCISNPQQAYAAKIINKKQICDNEYLKQSLKREFTIHSTLKHPNIVNLIEMHETANNIYIIQEYCDGTTLKQVLSTRKNLAQGEVRYCMQQICKGYSQLVQKGIIHRDLKPQNILIQGSDLKIGDFGFAKQIATQKQYLNSIVGSPIYMAPQILRGEKYNSKCDVWSFGIILFQLLYGFFPWHKGLKGPQNVMSLLKILTQPLKFPDSPEVSDQMKNFIQQCLQTDEKQRISWLQIFENPILSSQPQFSKIAQVYRHTAESAVNKLNSLANQVSVQQLIGSFLQFRQPSLDYPIFYKILKNYLIPDATQEQLSIMYQLFDKDCNGVVDLEQFVKAFQICNNNKALELLNQLVIDKNMYYQQMMDHSVFVKQSRSLKQYKQEDIEEAYQIINKINYQDKN